MSSFISRPLEGQCWQALEEQPNQSSWTEEDPEAQRGKCLTQAPIRSVGAEVRLESHLAKGEIGAERNGDGIDHQQHGQQQLKRPVLEQLLDIHSSDELMHIPGILGEGEGPSFRQVSP